MQVRKDIQIIQLFRGLAAISVVFYHYSWFVSPLEQTWLRHGYFGVDLFFMISGFLAFTTTRRLQGGWRCSCTYLIKRTTRIAPVYTLVTLLYFIVLLCTGSALSPLWLNTLKSVFYLPLSGGVSPAYGYAVVESGWTLNYEFFFMLRSPVLYY